MEISQPTEWVNKPFIGYIVNANFSDENAKKLRTLIQEIKEAFGDAVFCMPEESLHITLLDWVAPLVDYNGQDKAELFANLRDEYDKAMSEVLSSIKPITLHFDEIKVSPSTIYVTGHDDGEFKNIRQRFIEKVELLPGTKPPPQIIHCSLARFTKPIGLGSVNSFLAGKSLDLTQTVADFRLIRTEREPMLEFEILKRYGLGGASRQVELQ